MRLTSRDMDIVRAVARFRFLTAAQIVRLVSGSDQQIGRRIRVLFFHGFLDCPRVQRSQLAHVFEAGNFPLIYGIGQQGAHLIALHEPWINPKHDWTTNNGRVTAPFLAHTTETADVIIAFQNACAARALRLIDHHQLLPMMPEETRRPRRNHNPFKLKPTFTPPRENANIVVGVVPDRLFSLAAGEERTNYALELDRGTMDVDAKTLVGKSTIRRKILGYWHAWKQDLHTTQWGFKSFRVLFVTPSEPRLSNMLALQRAITNGGSNLFLFSTPERLDAAGPLGSAWISGNGTLLALP